MMTELCECNSAKHTRSDGGGETAAEEVKQSIKADRLRGTMGNEEEGK